METVYVCLVVLNSHANCKSKSTVEEPFEEVENFYNENMEKPMKNLKGVVIEAKKVAQTNIDTLEKETLHVTVLKEFFGPSHRIIRMFQDSPKKTSHTKN